MRNLYARLSVNPRATAKEIRSAYLAKARALHPDRGGGADTTALSEATEAYDVLRDEVKRRAYDLEFQRWVLRNALTICNACGAANKIDEVPKSQEAHCGVCHAILIVGPDDVQKRAKLQLALLAEEAAAESFALAQDGLKGAFSWIRKKAGIGDKAVDK